MADVPSLSPEPALEPIEVVIIATYPSVRAGLRALLAEQPDIIVRAAWPDDRWDPGIEPDLLLIDVESDRADLFARLAERFPEAAHVVLLEGPEELGPEHGGLSRPGAVLLKEAGASEILAAVRAVAQGLVVLAPSIAAQFVPRLAPSARPASDFEEHLTEREMEVLALLAQGLPNKTIAVELGISEHTAKFHVGSIMAKLGAASRTEAVAQAARRGLLVL